MAATTKKCKLLLEKKGGSMETLELKDLPHGYLSVTQAEMARKCPQQYYYRYIKGLKMPPPFVLVKGSSVHQTLNTYFRLKKEAHTSMLQDEFIDCFETDLESQIQKAKDSFGEIDYTRKEKQGKEWVKVKENPQTAKDRVRNETIPSLQNYHQLELFKLTPEESEKEFNIELSTGLKILVKIDYIDNERIIEYKSSTKKMKITRPTNQMLTYSLSKPGLEVRMDRILIKGENQIIPLGKINQETTTELLRDYDSVAKFIRSGIVFRNTGFNDMNCSMCGYKSICRKVL